MRLRIDLAYDGGDFHGWAAQPGPADRAGRARGGAGHRAADARAVGGLRRPHRHRCPRPRPGRPRRRRAGGARRGRRAVRRRPLRRPGPPAGRPAARRSPGTPGGHRARRLRRPLLAAVAALRLPGRPTASPTRSPVATCSPGRARSTSTRSTRPRPACSGSTTSRPSASSARARPRSAPCSTSPGSATGDLLTGTVRADAFCHHMVRSLVGLPARGRRGPPPGRLGGRGPRRRGPRPRRDRRTPARADAGGGRLPARRRPRRPRRRDPREAGDARDRPLLLRRPVGAVRARAVHLRGLGTAARPGERLGGLQPRPARRRHRGAVPRDRAAGTGARARPRHRVRRDRARDRGCLAPRRRTARRDVGGHRRRGQPARRAPGQRERRGPRALGPLRRARARRGARATWTSTRSGPTRRSGSASRRCTTCCSAGSPGCDPGAAR